MYLPKKVRYEEGDNPEFQCDTLSAHVYYESESEKTLVRFVVQVGRQ